MNTIRQSNANHIRMMWLAVALAMITAISYLLMAFNILSVGDLQMDEKPAIVQTKSEVTHGNR